MNNNRTVPPVLLAALLGLASGCSRAPTQVERDNRRTVDAILTSIAMKNVDWLLDNAKTVKERHAAGHLTVGERDRLQTVIDLASSGDWQGARKAGYEFRKQRPFVGDGQ